MSEMAVVGPTDEASDAIKSTACYFFSYQLYVIPQAGLRLLASEVGQGPGGHFQGLRGRDTVHHATE